MPLLIINQNKDELLKYYKDFNDVGCLHTVQHKQSENFYPISSGPVTNNDSMTLAKEYKNDGFGYIYKGILECMAREGAAYCKETTVKCDAPKTNSLTFYESYYKSTTDAAIAALKQKVCE